MSITASNNPFSCTPAIYGSINDYIIAKGVLSYADFLVTLSVGYQWKIQSVEYQNTTPFSIAITPETPGLKRIDIIVANTSNAFQLIQGVPFDDVVVTPNIPNNTILITTINVFGDAITTEETIVGSPFVKKSFAQGFVFPDITGANVSIPIPANGAYGMIVTNPLLTSIACLDLSAIVGNPSAEVPNQGKLLKITNQTGSPIEIKHATGAGIQFITKDALSIIIPNKESLFVEYNDDGVAEAFRSWSSAVASLNTENVTITNFWNHGSSFNYFSSRATQAGFNRETLDLNTGVTVITSTEILASASFFATDKSKVLKKIIVDSLSTSGTITSYLLQVVAYQKQNTTPFIVNVIDLGEYTFTKDISGTGYEIISASNIEIPSDYLVTVFLRKNPAGISVSGFDIKASITFKFDDYVA